MIALGKEPLVLSAKKCSTPFGITEMITLRAHAAVPVIEVLNAFRASQR